MIRYYDEDENDNAFDASDREGDNANRLRQRGDNSSTNLARVRFGWNIITLLKTLTHFYLFQHCSHC